MLRTSFSKSFASRNLRNQVVIGIVKWSKEETAVLVYFTSRNTDHEAYSKIIGLRYEVQEPRTANAVRIKLEEIRGNNAPL